MAGQSGNEMCLTNFDVYSLDFASGLSDVDLVAILWIGGDGEDLGGQLDRGPLGVLRLGGFPGGLVEGRAVACEFGRAGRSK
jgi:hypothetical protein